jgi:uncharacterized protein (UPF0332 family)
MMNEYELKNMMNNSDLLDAKIKYYFSNKLMGSTTSKQEIAGHIKKAEHNLKFVKQIVFEFNDWKLVVCYYAVYHAALALVASIGYSPKNHDAVLCLLIKYFYNSGLSKEDIELLNMFDTQDLLFYVESKQKREDAQYSTKIKFETREINKIEIKTALFVSKAKEITIS